jgi:hypothetical protein
MRESFDDDQVAAKETPNISLYSKKIGASLPAARLSSFSGSKERGITSREKKRPIKIFLVPDKAPRDVSRLGNKCWINTRYMTSAYRVTRGIN